MNIKFVLGAFAVLVLATIPASAFELALPSGNDGPDVDLCAAHTAQEIAEAGGVFTETYPTATPGMTVTVYMLCQTTLDASMTSLTDCTATSYSHTGWKWNSPYSAQIDPTNPDGLSSSGILSAFNAGGNTWDNAVAADIFGSFTLGGSASKISRSDGVNQHGFKKGGSYVAATWTWSSGGVAIESDAAYNTNYGWSLSGAAGKMDVQNVQTHEVGHTFGMGHSSSAAVNECLTMYPYVDYGQTNLRTLGDGDINGIKARY